MPVRPGVSAGAPGGRWRAEAGHPGARRVLPLERAERRVGPEQVEEETGEVTEGARIGLWTAGRPGRPRASVADVPRPVGPQLVIPAAPVRVGEDLVGLPDLLEAFRGLAVTRVQVGMVFSREATVGLLDRVRIGLLPDSQDGVVVAVLQLGGSRRLSFAGKTALMHRQAVGFGTRADGRGRDRGPGR